MKIIIIVFFMTVAYIVGMSKFEQYMSIDNLRYNSNYQSYSIIQNEDSERVTINITGEVNSPKRVTTNKGTTLGEVIAECGGLKATADIKCIDLSLIISKNINLHIPAFNLLVNKISLNDGTFDEIDSLPGIGATYANRIIEYRNTIGRFQYLEQLMEVNGIGQSTFNKVKDLITL